MIVHFTTVHPRDDSRIRTKELDTLARAFGGHVALYVQDGLGTEVDSRFGYEIVDTGPPLPRLARMTLGGLRMIRAVVAARPSIAHFHDPELLPWALLLKPFGIKVFYDVHEDMPQQVKHNPGLPRWARKTLSPFVTVAEWVGSRLIDGIVTPTKVIQQRFPSDRTILVRNYPLLEELSRPYSTPMADRPRDFAYVGYISEVRNIYGMVRAVGRTDPPARLRLVGSFAVPETEKAARDMPEWQNTWFQGWMSRDGVASVLGDVRAGLVLLKPIPHEMVTLPIKLFEYMAAGVPVIASNFPLWRKIVEEAACGLLVDPDDLDAIVRAMQWILDHPEEAQAMGRRGRERVETVYNWNSEASALVEFYRNRMGIEPAAV